MNDTAQGFAAGVQRVRHVYQAITAVTAIMAREGISKSRNNASQGYKFRGIDDVYCALSAHLAANGLCILPRVVARELIERTSKTGGAMSYVTLTVEFDLVSSQDGSTHTIRTMGEAMDSADKATNKAMSAAMKYACLMAFQIPTEGDNDADAHHPEPAARKPAATAAPVNVDAVVEAHTAAIDSAPTTAALMTIYTAVQADQGLPAAAKTYVVGLCSAKRKQLENGKAA